MRRSSSRYPAAVEPLESRQLLSSVTLDFLRGAGGVAGSGFSSVLPTSAGTGLVTRDLAISAGKLIVTTTPGDLYAGSNSQDNALDLPVDATRNFVVQTRILNPVFSRDYQSAGIFIGNGEDDYIKVVVGQIGSRSVQLGSESGGEFSRAAQKALNFAGAKTLDLRMIGYAATNTVLAQYRINSDAKAAWVTIGQVTRPSAFGAAAKTGIVTTNSGTSFATKVSFDSFSLQSDDPVATTLSGPFAVGNNRDVTTLAGNEAEAQIAVNPINSKNWVVVSQSNVNNGAALILTRTYDAGATWLTTQITNAQDGMPWGNQRPDGRVAFDGFGNLYVIYDVAASKKDVRLIVLRSADGGASFAAPIAAVSGGAMYPDSPAIATGPDADDPSRQAIWIAFTDQRAGTLNYVAGTSSKLGQFAGFSSQGVVTNSYGTTPSVSIGPSGEVAVAWQPNQNGNDPGGLLVNVNRYGIGGDFGDDQWVTGTNVGTWDPLPAQPDRTVDAEPKVAFDRSGGPTDGRLYFAYTDASAPGNTDTDIELRYSDDLGENWSSPVQVNDDTSGRSQFLPSLAVDQTTGNVGLAWYDARNSAGDNTTQLFATVSSDHGGSVFSNVAVSASVSDQARANVAGTPDLDYGDLASVAFNNGQLIPVWSDNSNSAGHNPNGGGSRFDVYASLVTFDLNAPSKRTASTSHKRHQG